MAIGDVLEAWDDLSPAWLAVFDEAWRSFRTGNFGIGAVLVDGTGNVVARGRNMVFSKTGDQPLAGNYMAHAEMNLFAGMASFDAKGLQLLSTLQPCLMCASTSLFLNVETISYAADDEYFNALDGLWPHHPYTAARAVPTVRVCGGTLSSFARLLPMSVTLSTFPDSSQEEAARTAFPEVARLASDAAFLERLRSLEAPVLGFRLVDRALSA